MFKNFKIPHSILRNLLILALSVAVVLATKSVSDFVSAQGETPGGSIDMTSDDRYVDLLTTDKNFDTGCGSDTVQHVIDEFKDPISMLVNKYHDTMNCMFNKRIESMVSKMKSDEPLTDKQLADILKSLSPPGLSKNDKGEIIGREKCETVDGEPPLSTYCLAQDGLNEYFAFRKAMLIEKVKAQGDTIQKFQTVSGAGQSVGSGLLDYAARVARVDRELQIAVQTLDQGLAAYNELQMALPLHKKYKEIIKSLEHYRDKVSGIRTEAEFFPATFIDVMTTKCT